ncbi:hypothetical protein TPHA_0B00160 [Tetrapisispora phaffii CBS 4417]|uniref:Uncharacterized protein n=1 Tax=Tetrapisispora phaffii (strain ATCC 24235 / CBS 4417 / NBRC 1672 / NRRL Y-8282 / UCD 70-5) TaxID=1071381 RepID=G8BQ91_TETPH|nr:hypothetical protein TPHA_0B00160 [Tetrapisispora phaffii CBS 4417]CCE61688.1 hypothetical protein TPHA_0B00160 [Tetrapisispora phaffii CBS 4417]
MFRTSKKVIVAVGNDKSNTLLVPTPCWISSAKKRTTLNLNLQEINATTISKINTMNTFSPTLYPDRMELGTLTEQEQCVSPLLKTAFFTVRNLETYVPVIFINCTQKDAIRSMKLIRYCVQCCEDGLKYSPFIFVSLLDYPVQYELKRSGTARWERLIKFAGNSPNPVTLIEVCRNIAERRYGSGVENAKLFLKEGVIRKRTNCRHYREMGFVIAESNTNNDWKPRRYPNPPTYSEIMPGTSTL